MHSETRHGNLNFEAFELEGIRFEADLEVDITTFDSQNVLGLITLAMSDPMRSSWRPHTGTPMA
jgi:hypothetical protein